ncbi:AarF/UbiB family protein [Streptosporangium sandarakinum]|uniref:AarF/UbiB family protein n=1 Tax=Streptosporangium sandarakinum TaxID=1260955 RepID=UPI0033A8A8B9
MPVPYPGPSGRRVLVMERLEGVPLGSAAPERGEEPARTLFETLLRQVMLHDPHPGNLMLLGDGRLATCGCSPTSATGGTSPACSTRCWSPCWRPPRA